MSRNWKDGDECRWENLKAVIYYLGRDGYCLLLLYPQPGVTSNTRWQTAAVRHLREAA